MTQDWTTPVNAYDVLSQQKRRADIEVRRPLPRKASDLVGPGIGAAAVRIDDYNDLLATFNGYYASEPGATNAPNDSEAFIGQVVSDATLGGRQVFTGLDSGTEYARTFTRAPVAPEAIEWGPWTGQRIPASAAAYLINSVSVPHNSTTLLLPPPLHTIGDPSVYEPTAVGIFVRKQGVYTGNIRVGSNSAITANVTIQRPDGLSTVAVVYGSQNLGETRHFPFTVWASDENQGFSVSVLQASGAPATCWWQFQCARIGDAV